MDKKIFIICMVFVFQTVFSAQSNNNGPTVYETVSSIKLPSQETCGRTNTSDVRILGGMPSELGAWPWMVALGYQFPKIKLGWLSPYYLWNCGGALISDRYVLTAAHCTVNSAKQILVTVRLGDLNLDSNVTDGSEPIDIPISQIMVHEQYEEKQSYINDIALLKLEKNVIFNEFIQPICLPVLSHHRTNKLLDSAPFVAGWGSESLKGPLSSVLMEIQVPVIDNAECKRAYYYSKKIIIDDRIICAGSGGKDACHGDSGSPLMWPSGSQYYLVGVVSAGFNCGEPEYPGVYTRVSYFVDWIVDKMNNS